MIHNFVSFSMCWRGAEVTFGSKPIHEAVGRTRAIIGLQKMPAGADDAQQALNALRNGQVPPAPQLAALELMIRLMRPAPLCRFGKVDDLPEYNQYNNSLVGAWHQFQEAVQPSIYAVGRLDRADDTNSLGTGFLVTDELLVTNYHVLAALSHGTGLLRDGDALVYFGQEFEPTDRQGAVPVTAVVAADEEVDLAILRVSPSPTSPGRRPFVISEAAVAAGDNVATLGYPMEGANNNPLFLKQIFGNELYVKRASQGQVLKVSTNHVYHDCSTLNGNSGSPLMTLENAKVIGVHNSGDFMYRNGEIDANTLGKFLKPQLPNDN